jgi:hypothetical protein
VLKHHDCRSGCVHCRVETHPAIILVAVDTVFLPQYSGCELLCSAPCLVMHTRVEQQAYCRSWAAGPGAPPLTLLLQQVDVHVLSESANLIVSLRAHCGTHVMCRVHLHMCARAHRMQPMAAAYQGSKAACASGSCQFSCDLLQLRVVSSMHLSFSDQQAGHVQHGLTGWLACHPFSTVVVSTHTLGSQSLSQ